MRSFVTPFVDITLTFVDSSFSLFLFDVNFFIVYHQNLAFFTKLGMSILLAKLLAKFACFDFAANFFDVNLLNSTVVIYLS